MITNEFPSRDASRRLVRHADEIQSALARAKQKLLFNAGTEFDVRGELYHLAHCVSPRARHAEIEIIRKWMRPRRGERAIDISAGSGFLTKYLERWTASEIWAIDPSATQIALLRERHPTVAAVCGYPDDPSVLAQLPDGVFNIASSLGAIHHVQNQQALFANLARILTKGGRFVFGDVCAQTSVSRHFDEIVAKKCLTGHTARWLSPARLQQLIQDLPLTVVRAEIVPMAMRFRSELEMILFFKGLHAYDLDQEEILTDLKDVLGYTVSAGQVLLHWPLLFTHIERI